MTHAAAFFTGHKVELLDLIDYEMPLSSVDRLIIGGVPQLAWDLTKKIDGSNFLLIALAENNTAYTLAFKNILTGFLLFRSVKRLGVTSRLS